MDVACLMRGKPCCSFVIHKGSPEISQSHLALIGLGRRLARQTAGGSHGREFDQEPFCLDTDRAVFGPVFGLGTDRAVSGSNIDQAVLSLGTPPELHTAGAVALGTGRELSGMHLADLAVLGTVPRNPACMVRQWVWLMTA